jgi:cytochrome c oxidase assembly factor CtaG
LGVLFFIAMLFFILSYMYMSHMLGAMSSYKKVKAAERVQFPTFLDRFAPISAQPIFARLMSVFKPLQ